MTKKALKNLKERRVIGSATLNALFENRTLNPKIKFIAKYKLNFGYHIKL